MRRSKVETREGLYTWRELGREFCERFGKALGWPMELTRRLPVTACWRGRSGLLEQVLVLPYMRPLDRETAGMPSIPRVAVNCYRTLVPRAMLRRLRAVGYAVGVQQTAERLELSVLPEELFDFAPWVAERVRVLAAGFPEAISEPPHRVLGAGQSEYVWSESAWRVAQRWSMLER